MRDFRDAKAMAQTLRDSLSHKAMTISHSESLELVSKMLGLADWNTLAAVLQADRAESPSPAPRLKTRYPAIPLRDLVPFPGASYPLFVGRDKSIQAISQAWEGGREVVLAIQRDGAVDEPGLENVYEIGLLAELLEVRSLPDGTEGTRQVQTRAIRRVMIRRFTMEAGPFHAEVTEIRDGPIPDASDLVRSVVKRLEGHAAAGAIPLPDAQWLSFEPARDPGRVADIIASCMKMPMSDRYELLATLDPVARLQKVDARLDLSARPISPIFEKTKQRAFREAVQRQHQYATLEHLLLALIDDPDASAVMQACNANLDALKDGLIRYLGNELTGIVVENVRRSQPTAAFQRVEQRAARHALEWGHAVVTGAHALFGLFAESQSPAARLLREQNVSQLNRAAFIALGFAVRTN
ncbi:MAG TPA: LON peptidase substrate-binding domain-containing protein [Bradyrhizobium sp.]|nr:LON peptidase substrate-binding domain-containing protein [Bradyrhizobium sp.]